MLHNFINITVFYIEYHALFFSYILAIFLSLSTVFPVLGHVGLLVILQGHEAKYFYPFLWVAILFLLLWLAPARATSLIMFLYIIV
jgi:hypothetical protein